MLKYIGVGAVFYTLIYEVWLAYAHKYNIDGMAGLGGDDQSWFWTRLLFPIICPIQGGIAGAVTYAVTYQAKRKRLIAATISLIICAVIFGPVIAEYQQGHKAWQIDRGAWPLYLIGFLWILALFLCSLRGEPPFTRWNSSRSRLKSVFWSAGALILALIGINFVVDAIAMTKGAEKHAQWEARWMR